MRDDEMAGSELASEQPTFICWFQKDRCMTRRRRRRLALISCCGCIAFAADHNDNGGNSFRCSDRNELQDSQKRCHATQGKVKSKFTEEA